MWTSLRKELVGCKRFENATGLHQICDRVAKAIPKQDSNQKKKRKIIDAQPVPDKPTVKRKKVNT